MPRVIFTIFGTAAGLAIGGAIRWMLTHPAEAMISGMAIMATSAVFVLLRMLIGR